MKHSVIYSNKDPFYDGIEDDYKDFLEANGMTEDEYSLDQYAYEMVDCWLDDEKVNLDIETEGRILVIGDLGFWDGRKQGYKILRNNVSAILADDGDYVEWFDDGYNVRCTSSNHDATSYYEYRVIREDRNIDNLINAIYNGEEITRKKLNYYTKSLHSYVAGVYGW